MLNNLPGFLSIAYDQNDKTLVFQSIYLLNHVYSEFFIFLNEKGVVKALMRNFLLSFVKIYLTITFNTEQYYYPLYSRLFNFKMNLSLAKYSFPDGE